MKEMVTRGLGRGAGRVDDFLGTVRGELRIVAVFLSKGLEGRSPLAELRACFRFVRRNARATDGRDQNRRQNTNDRDHGEEFDQGEARRGAERLRTAAKEAHGSLSA